MLTSATLRPAVPRQLIMSSIPRGLQRRGMCTSGVQSRKVQKVPMQAGTSSTTTPKPPLVATTNHFSGLADLLASRMAQLTAAATATVILPALIPAAALSVTSGGDAHASVPAGVVMLLAAAVLIAVEAYQRQQAGENFNMQKAFSQVLAVNTLEWEQTPDTASAQPPLVLAIQDTATEQDIVMQTVTSIKPDLPAYMGTLDPFVAVAVAKVAAAQLNIAQRGLTLAPQPTTLRPAKNAAFVLTAVMDAPTAASAAATAAATAASEGAAVIAADAATAKTAAATAAAATAATATAKAAADAAAVLAANAAKAKAAATSAANAKVAAAAVLAADAATAKAAATVAATAEARVAVAAKAAAAAKSAAAAAAAIDAAAVPPQAVISSEASAAIKTPQAENLAQQHDDKIKGFRNEQTRCTVTQEHPTTVSCEPTPVVEAVAQRLPSAAQGTAAVQGLSEETVVAERRPQGLVEWVAAAFMAFWARLLAFLGISNPPGSKILPACH